MFLDWLLKMEVGNISYEELRSLPRKYQDGVNEDGNCYMANTAERHAMH